MKKLVAAALLSVVAIGSSAGTAHAWVIDNCLHKLFRPCCRDCATLCIRPYNAFTPTAYGTLCLDGCTPFAGFNGGGNGGGYNGGCGNGGCYNGGFLPPTPYAGGVFNGAEGLSLGQFGGNGQFGQLPQNGQTIMLPPTFANAPAGSTPTFTPPAPSPLPAGAAPTSMIYPGMPNNPNIRTSNYRPAAAPGMNYNPMMQAPAQGNAFGNR